MKTQHAVVWLDHREAKIFFFDREHADEVKLSTGKHFDQAHKHAGTLGGGRAVADMAFLHGIVEALQPAAEWLFIGPGSAKDELTKHVTSHHPADVARIVSVESADHPTNGQIVALARKFFKAADRML